MSEYTLDDGRKAEKVENSIDSLTKVTEVYVEPKQTKKLSQRITERLCVCEREIETLDESTGQVINKVVEKLCEGVSEQKHVELKSPMQKIVEEKLKSSKSKNLLFATLVVAQVLVLVYVVFFM